MPAAKEPPPDPLLDLLRTCVVRVDAADGFRGSGFLVAPGEVLTCAHVVHGTNDVMVRGTGWEAEARVAARWPDVDGEDPAARFYPFPDVALLTLSSPPGGLPCVQLEPDEPAVGPPGDMLRLEAFTKGEHAPDVVRFSQATIAFEGTIEEDEVRLLKLAGGQVLAGFSGCPVMNLRTGRVCALVDSSRDTRSALGGFGVPLSALADELEGLLARSAAHHQRDDRWARAVEEQRVLAQKRAGELDRLPLDPPALELWSVDDPQSDLLRPRYRVVDLVGRELLSAELGRWRDSDAPLEVALVLGGGGFGKTRLAIELCRDAARAGWTAGLLRGDLPTDEGAWTSALADWSGRLFVAVDYAQTRPDAVRRLIIELLRRSARPPARLVLMCRQVISRKSLEDLFAAGASREEVSGVLRRAEPVRLPEQDLDRHRLFGEAARAFASYVDGDPSIPEGLSLRAPHLGRPQFLAAAALLRCQDPMLDVDALSAEDLMLEVIDTHEVRYGAQQPVQSVLCGGPAG